LGRGRNKLIRPALIVSEDTLLEYSIFLEHLLVGLTDESIPAALVCPVGCEVDSIVPPSVEVVSLPTFTMPLMGGKSREIVIERLKDFKADVLHCFSESKAALTRLLAQQLAVPYVLTVNSLHKRWGRIFVPLKDCFKVIVPAESIATSVTRIYPRLAERVTQINIGTFVGETSGCFSEPGLLASMVTDYSSGNEEAFENLLGAARHLLIDGYEFMLVIMGGVRGEKGLRRLIAAMDLSQIVVCVPRLKPWRSVLAAGDIFIRPWPSDAFDPLLLEAMSVGAAVAGCKGGVDDLIIEGKTAVVFDPNDELSIYNSLKGLFDRQESARQLAAGAQKYLRDNHTVNKMVADIVQVYREAVR